MLLQVLAVLVHSATACVNTGEHLATLFQMEGQISLLFEGTTTPWRRAVEPRGLHRGQFIWSACLHYECEIQKEETDIFLVGFHVEGSKGRRKGKKKLTLQAAVRSEYEETSDEKLRKKRREMK